MKNIIFLLPELIFLEKDYIRFGINTLKKNFSAKILDSAAWINPNFWNSYSKKIYKCEEYITISCKEDFLNFISQIDNSIVIDCVVNNEKTNWMKQLLKNKNNLFVHLSINLHPGRLNFIQRLKILFATISQPKRFIYKLYNFLKHKYYNLQNNTFDISVLGGLEGLNKLKSKNVINAHSMDYDVYLGIKNKPIVNDSYAVFIDEDMPSHQDYTFHNTDHPPIDEFQYYSILVKFLKKFEIETNLRIKFAVHPKSLNKNLPNILKDVDYSIGNTAELVKNSSAVLLHASTSVSYAILFKKPTIFLTSNKLKKTWIGPRIDNLAKVINGQVLCMDSDLGKPLVLSDILKIDENKYKNYLDQYLKVPNSPDIPLWEIFTNYIKSNQFEKIIP